MAGLDIFLLVCFVPGIVSGISKGLVKQLVDLAALVIGAWAAFKFHAAAADWLRQTFTLTMDVKVLNIISFLCIAIAMVLVLNIIGSLITKVLRMADLNWINRVLGVLFGLLKAALVLGLLAVLFDTLNNQWQIIDPARLDNAVVYNALIDFCNKIFPFLKSLITGPDGSLEIINA